MLAIVICIIYLLATLISAFAPMPNHAWLCCDLTAYAEDYKLNRIFLYTLGIDGLYSLYIYTHT